MKRNISIKLPSRKHFASFGGLMCIIKRNIDRNGKCITVLGSKILHLWGWNMGWSSVENMSFRSQAWSKPCLKQYEIQKRISTYEEIYSHIYIYNMFECAYLHKTVCFPKSLCFLYSDRVDEDSCRGNINLFQCEQLLNIVLVILQCQI